MSLIKIHFWWIDFLENTCMHLVQLNETVSNQTWTLKILKLWFDWSKWNPLFCIWAVSKLIIYQPWWRLLQVCNPSCHRTSFIKRLLDAICWFHEKLKGFRTCGKSNHDFRFDLRVFKIENAFTSGQIFRILLEEYIRVKSF